MRSTSFSSLLAAAFVCGAVHCVPAAAQDYPSKSVTIVVPLAAGTGMDSIARFYGDALGKALGKAVLIENQPGATLTLAAQNVARAAPDGHTLLVSATLQMSAPQAVIKKVNYDPEKDFVPIAVYLSSPFVLIVNPALGAGSMEQLIALAKSRGADPLTYATSGTGSFPHLAMEALKNDLGFAANHVPYRNSGQIITDVVGGHVAASMSETGAALTLIKDGRLKALAITSSGRHPQLPEVPTMAEATGRAGYEAVTWHALLAPAATPAPIVDRLVREMMRITGESSFQQRVSAVGLIPRAPMTSPQMEGFLKAERVRWGGFVKTLGIEAAQ
jgi:tripartite-type tricarboxylate transporter receptor subunit TctC